MTRPTVTMSSCRGRRGSRPYDMNIAPNKITALVIFGIVLMSLGGSAHAVDNVPPVNLNQSTFKLVQCDGPEGIGHVIPGTDKIDISKNPDGTYKYPLKEGFIPCNFKGLMMQAQFLINAAIVIGVLAAMIGFAYSGFLYITGTQENLKKAKSIFPKIFWGFIIMLTAWFIVYQILKWLTPAGSAYL